MTRRIDVTWDGQRASIEYAWVGEHSAKAPVLVFLHEGLGSLAMWKDFPEQLCRAAGARGLVFSRPGYGRSTPRQAEEVWDVDYLHRQAHALLPALLDALDITRPVWLLGHSDGGSIALLHAAEYPARVAGLVLLAPHIFVEDLTVASIDAAREAYLDTDLPTKLARHHDDADFVFWRWNRIWLHPAFRRWNITNVLHDIRCPVLAIQGLDDAYGTLAQIRGIAHAVPGTTLLELPDCGHSAHRDQPAQVIAAVVETLQNVRRH